MIPALGERWHDRYRLLRELGGGASAVFTALDERRDEHVVLKILRPNRSEERRVGKKLR